MIAERTLAQAAHAWGAQGVPFYDEPKTELFRAASMERATALLNQSAALRSLMLLSGENGAGKSAMAGGCALWNPRPTSLRLPRFGGHGSSK
jgi:hypothetical protein